MKMAGAVLLNICCWWSFLFITAHTYQVTDTLRDRSFRIDYDNNTFVKDGKPFRYVSGSIHYHRIPHQYWRDRLEKVYSAGLNAIQVYIPWNYHEPQPGVYLWDGDRNLTGFLRTAQSVGLQVLLRAGPYIDAGWDFGGIPGWILKHNGSVVVRTMDPGFIKPVEQWFSVLLPRIKPMLYDNGGPVLMVQVENEYGSYYACDHAYMKHLATTFRKHLGPEVILYTVDGVRDSMLKCGTTKDAYATVDFGPGGNVKEYFALQRKYSPKGPLVNTEYYTGVLDKWGDKHSHTDTDFIIKYFTQILDMGANVNMYMFHGGTNFGYTNGVYVGPSFKACVTSYDHDAPMTEAGDTTHKYQAIRQVLLQPKYKLHDKVAVPPNSTKADYGKLPMQLKGSVLDLLHIVGPDKSVSSRYPKSMEELGVNEGFMLYRTILTRDYSSEILNVTGIRDRGYILVNRSFKGVVERTVSSQVTFSGRKGQNLDILVENQGHTYYDPQVGERKGLVANVTIGKEVLCDWNMFALNFTKLFDTSSIHPKTSYRSDSGVPSVFIGKLNLSPSQQHDTYLNPTGWFKGQVFINGFNLGRYWPVKGPQVTLYVPGSVWNREATEQTVMLVELESAPCPTTTDNNCTVAFQKYPVINKNI